MTPSPKPLPPVNAIRRIGVIRKVVVRRRGYLDLSCGHSIPVKGAVPMTSWRICTKCAFPGKRW